MFLSQFELLTNGYRIKIMEYDPKYDYSYFDKKWLWKIIFFYGYFGYIGFAWFPMEMDVSSIRNV